MEKRIRRPGIFMVLCFVALFIRLDDIQVLKAKSLADARGNPKVIGASRSQTRGSILSSNGAVLARSVRRVPGRLECGGHDRRRLLRPHRQADHR